MLTAAIAKLAQADITVIVHKVDPYDLHQDLHRSNWSLPYLRAGS